MAGYINIKRKLFRHWLWTERRKYSKLEAWLDIITSVRYGEEEKSGYFGGKKIEWSRGDWPALIRFLSERWGWNSTSRVKRFHNELKAEALITISSNQGQNIITLIPNDLFLLPEQQENTNRTDTGTVKEHQTKHQENAKKYNIVVDHANTETPNGTAKEQQTEHQRNTNDSETERIRNKEEIRKSKENKEKTMPSASLRDSAEVDIESLLGPHAEKFRELDVVIRACDRVSQMPSQLTPSEYLKLLEEFDTDQVHDIILIMDNWKKLNKNNVSVYFTAQTWLKRNFGGGNIQELIPLFEEEYRAFCKRESIGAKIDANERRALRGLITYLIENNVQSTKEGALSAWKYILAPKNWSKLDRFTRKRIKLQDIESDIIKIMAQLKEANKPGSDRFQNYWDRRLDKRT